MSKPKKSKYQPPVNKPEAVPNNPQNPASITVLFLNSTGQWLGVPGNNLGLMQVGEGRIGLCFPSPDGKGFGSLIEFPGTLVLEKKLVVAP